MKASLLIPGPPRTKKNHSRVVRIPGKGGGRGYTKVLPSEAYCVWESAAVPGVRAAWVRGGNDPIQQPVNCRALVYRDAKTGDAVGYYQGIADLLETAGVVRDDKWIVSWDGSRLLVDRERPRVEILLEGED